MPRHRTRPQKKAIAKSVSTNNSSSIKDLPYVVQTSDIMGRYLVASRDLEEGCVLIREAPLVVGPAQDSLPLCLGCCCPIEINNISTATRCQKCVWPLCSLECKGLNNELGHSIEECLQLSTCRLESDKLPKNQLYNAIVPLRCLLQKEHHPEKWNILMTMEAHNDVRKNLPLIWEYNQKTVVDRLIKEWNINKYSEEDIHTVCGILEVNAFTVGSDTSNMRGVYPTSYLIAHSCVNNTAHTDDSEYNMTLFATVPIPKGELITLAYTNLLQGTRKRREHLRQCKFFDCECARCNDPTELGTYLSALKCNECNKGHLLSTNPLKSDAEWVCDSRQCGKSLAAVNVDILSKRIDKIIQQSNQNTIDELEYNILKCEKYLHRNHYSILGMKYTLSHLYGKTDGFLIQQMSEDLLKRKIQICEDILNVFNIIHPGLSNLRGLTMYELHAPIMVLTIQRFQMKKISKEELKRKLREVDFYLRQCIKIFQYETNNSEEGYIRTAAESALTQLKSWEAVVGKL